EVGAASGEEEVGAASSSRAQYENRVNEFYRLVTKGYDKLTDDEKKKFQELMHEIANYENDPNAPPEFKEFAAKLREASGDGWNLETRPDGKQEWRLRIAGEAWLNRFSNPEMIGQL